MFCPRCRIQLEEGACPDCGERAPSLRSRNGADVDVVHPPRPVEFVVPKSLRDRLREGEPRPHADEKEYHWDSGLD